MSRKCFIIEQVIKWGLHDSLRKLIYQLLVLHYALHKIFCAKSLALGINMRNKAKNSAAVAASSVN